jgi:GTPase SAR1 family protein
MLVTELMLLGNAGAVGKSSLVMQFAHKQHRFEEEYDATVEGTRFQVPEPLALMPFFFQMFTTCR